MAKQKVTEVNGIARLLEMRRQAEAGQAPDDESFRTRFPALYSILANNRISEKTWTDPARLSISNANGEWNVMLAVPGLGAFTSVLGATLDQGLGELEARLASGVDCWSFNLKRRAHVRKFGKSENED